MSALSVKFRTRDLPNLAFIFGKVEMLIFAMKTQGICSFGSHAQVHEGCIAAACAQHVKGHQEEQSRHAQAGIAEHALKCYSLSAYEVFRRKHCI